MGELVAQRPAGVEPVGEVGRDDAGGCGLLDELLQSLLAASTGRDGQGDAVLTALRIGPHL
ncbi:hypothetical protein [Kitasatospora sp. Ki12]